MTNSKKSNIMQLRDDVTAIVSFLSNVLPIHSSRIGRTTKQKEKGEEENAGKTEDRKLYKR